MSNKKPNLIWIDAHINNSENTGYQEKFKETKRFEFLTYEKVDDGIEKLKDIFFEDTYLIVSGSLYPEFISYFKDNLKDIYTIPKIIIFCSNKGNFMKRNMNFKEYFEHPYFNAGGIQTKFSEVMDFVLNKNKKISFDKEKKYEEYNKNDELIDRKKNIEEYIDKKEKLYLPLYYKTLIKITDEDNIDEYNQYLYKKFLNNIKINNLLSPIINLSKIPNELLCKYYTRLYTLDTPLYKEMNKNLRKGNVEEYKNFIKVMYEGLKLNCLSSSFNETLYRGTSIKKSEIEIIKKYLNKKIEDLPGAIVYSKTFLSFTENVNNAKSFLGFLGHTSNNEISPVLYILEKDNNIDESLLTNVDCEKISPFQEKEILFLPFSCFEIKDIRENLGGYEINLLYLGKYEKELGKIKMDEIIPDSLFKNNLKEFGIIEEEKITNLTSENLIDNINEYKTEYYKHKINKHEIICDYNIKKDKYDKSNFSIRPLNCYEESNKDSPYRELIRISNNQIEEKKKEKMNLLMIRAQKLEEKKRWVNFININQINQLKNEIKTKENEKKQLEDNLENIKKRNEELKNEINIIKNNKIETERKNDEIKEENNEIKLKILECSSLMEEVSRLNEQLRILRGRNQNNYID